MLRIKVNLHELDAETRRKILATVDRKTLVAKLEDLDPEAQKQILAVVDKKNHTQASEQKTPRASGATGGGYWQPALVAIFLGLLLGMAVFTGYSELRPKSTYQPVAAVHALFNGQANRNSSAPPAPPPPPQLIVISPAEGGKITSSSLLIRGRTDPGATVRLKTAWAGENPLNVDQNGGFSYVLQLPPRPVTEVTLTATNTGGNTTKTIHLNDPAAQVPENYYMVVSPYGHYQNTLADLKSFLDGFRLPRRYERNVFDCSDSSAMLQWALTISGFKASIVTGPCPWDKNLGEHAWVIVHCNDYTAAVEATALTKRGFLKELFNWSTPGLIYSNHPSAANYYGGYTKEYQDIYAAARAYGSVKEWEWWAGVWGFK